MAKNEELVRQAEERRKEAVEMKKEVEEKENEALRKKQEREKQTHLEEVKSAHYQVLHLFICAHNVMTHYSQIPKGPQGTVATPTSPAEETTSADAQTSIGWEPPLFCYSVCEWHTCAQLLAS